jgi:hypothetical protein
MKFISYFFVFLTFLYFCFGLALSQFQLKNNLVPISKSIKNKDMSYFDYKGVINVHSELGQGQGTIPEILKSAYESKLDFIVFTENTLTSDINLQDRYEENLLVLNGREYSYLKSRLILVDPKFDFTQIKTAGDAHLFLSDYLEENRDGFVLLKHPLKPGYNWEGEFAQGIDGIEIISLRSHWRDSWEKSKWNFILSLLMYPFNPEYAFLNIYQPPQKTLKLWNALATERKIIGLIGSDAKSKLKVFNLGFLKFPSYKQLFQLSSNHLVLPSELTGQFKLDSKKVHEALNKGQFYFSLDFLGSPEGFNFIAKTKPENTSVSYMGDSIGINQNHFCVYSPNSSQMKAWWVLYKNGKKIFSSKKDDCFVSKDPGSYNVIVYKKVKRPWPFKSLKVPWIYSNFIYKKT